MQRWIRNMVTVVNLNLGMNFECKFSVSYLQLLDILVSCLLRHLLPIKFVETNLDMISQLHVPIIISIYILLSFLLYHKK